MLCSRLSNHSTPLESGARDLQESLLIQLHHLEMDDSLAWKIVQHYLSQLDERYFQKIAKSFGAHDQ